MNMKVHIIDCLLNKHERFTWFWCQLRSCLLVYCKQRSEFDWFIEQLVSSSFAFFIAFSLCFSFFLSSPSFQFSSAMKLLHSGSTSHYTPKHIKKVSCCCMFLISFYSIVVIWIYNQWLLKVPFHISILLHLNKIYLSNRGLRGFLVSLSFKRAWKWSVMQLKFTIHTLNKGNFFNSDQPILLMRIVALCRHTKLIRLDLGN